MNKNNGLNLFTLEISQGTPAETQSQEFLKATEEFTIEYLMKVSSSTIQSSSLVLYGIRIVGFHALRSKAPSRGHRGGQVDIEVDQCTYNIAMYPHISTLRVLNFKQLKSRQYKYLKMTLSLPDLYIVQNKIQISAYAVYSYRVTAYSAVYSNYYT